jgi:Tol biopolymer transport system component
MSSVLQAGARLGPYEIVGPLGAGGMGEVYKARDTRLDRTVAVKVLPASLAQDPIFRERFDREARTISSLDHPNVCVLYDVGRDGGVDYLVMQFLDGETLAARLGRGPLPPGQAVEYAAQIAAALDRAHRAGIVHRDLKPGNVMVTRGGVKLLDFGLAKMPVFKDAGMAAATMTSPLTGQGTIVGTLQYMAPEQLEAGEVDARSDIFAFGAILYEMLTGQRAFEAASQAGVMAAILGKEPPPLSSVQPLLPPGLDRIVQRCLAKDPDARWQSAADLGAALSWVRTDSGAIVAPVTQRPSRRGWLIGAAAAALLLIAGAIAGGALLNRRAVPPRTVQSVLMSPPIRFAVPELSPDGSTLAWSASNFDTGPTPIWLQPLDSAAGRAIPGTEGAMFAFWSPDGRNLGFFADQKLKRVAVSGGAPVILCDVADADPRGGSWGLGDVIIFSGARIGGLSRVSASGGVPQPLTTLDKAAGHTTHRWPYFLPDGRHFLYFASTNNDPSLQSHDAIMLASIDSGEPQRLLQATSNAAVADGRLLFVSQNRLMAQPFDPASGTLSGQAAPVLDRVSVGYEVTRAMFTAAGALLVAAPDEPSRERVEPQWLAPDGTRKPVVEGMPAFETVWLSPDGSHIATTLLDERTRRSDIWTFDIKSGGRLRVTFDGNSFTPVWSRDGATIFYLQEQAGHTILLASRPAGGGAERILARSLPTSAELHDCSAGYCVFSAWRPEAGTNYDLLAVRLSDGAIVPAAVTEADENDGHLSPDGRLLAYGFEQNGEENVFVRSFPSGTGLWQVSTAGGSQPIWSRDGRELYFLTDRDIVAVPVSTGGGFTAGPPRTIALRALSATDASMRVVHAEPAPDGRLLVIVPQMLNASVPYRLVLNWNR